MRLAVMLAINPEANLTRTLAMSNFEVSTGTPTAWRAHDLAGIHRQNDIEIVNHHVEDDVDVEAPHPGSH